MDAKQHLFYGLGHIAYAVALADGKLQESEKEIFHRLMKEEMARVDSDFDYSDIIFQVLEKEHVDFETAYHWGIDAIRLGDHKMTPALKWEFLDIIYKVAERFPPVTIKEHEIISRFARDLRNYKKVLV